MVVKKKTLNNKLKSRSKNNNRTHKKRQLKKTKKQNRNNIQLGGGSDIDIFYKAGILKKDIKPIKIGETDTNYSGELVQIPYKKLHALPEIKVKTNGKYRLDFYCKEHSIPSSSSSSSTHTRSSRSSSSSEILFATYTVRRSGTLFHSQSGTISENKLDYIMNNFAREGRLVALTIIIKIFKEDNNKKDNNKKYTNKKFNFNEKFYFNLDPK